MGPLDDERAIHFAIELSAVQVIANLETLLASQLGGHERPVEAHGEVSREDQPFFNVIGRPPLMRRAEVRGVRARGYGVQGSPGPSNE